MAITRQDQIDELFGVIFLLIMLFVVLVIWKARWRPSSTVVLMCIVFFCSFYIRTCLYQLVNAGGREPLGGIYVNSAYRTADNEIRFMYYRNSALRSILKYWNGADYKDIQERKIDPIMRLFVDCQVEAHIGVVRYKYIEDAATPLQLTTDTSSEVHRVRVKDVRPPPNFNPAKYEYPHKLGVCLQPIYLHADWTLVVQYFEFWLASGATKFFIYLHSATRQVRAILDFYKRKLGTDLEIIEWSDLPIAQRDRGDFHQDPNTRLFQVGLYAAINDCVLRARYQVKFLSMLDLDETLQVPSGKSVVHELEAFSILYPNMGTASLQWIYAEQENENSEARYPHELRFNSLSKIRKPAKDQVHDAYANFRKLIQRPERVVLTDIHSTLVNELHGKVKQEWLSDEHTDKYPEFSL